MARKVLITQQYFGHYTEAVSPPLSPLKGQWAGSQ